MREIPDRLSVKILQGAARQLEEEESVSPPDTAPAIEDEAPTEPSLTDYDRAHLVTYLRLLDAAKAGAAWEDAALIVLGLDPAREPERAKRAHESHLERARWLSEFGYRYFLQDYP
jgi:hypothetical protein